MADMNAFSAKLTFKLDSGEKKSNGSSIFKSVGLGGIDPTVGQSEITSIASKIAGLFGLDVDRITFTKVDTVDID